MAKRPRFSRWRRLPGAYRSGDQSWPASQEEPQRVSLYVKAQVFDRAVEQAERLGYANAQDYLTDVVLKAVEAERIREQVAEVEARRGPLEGFQAIASDPEYLAELQNAQGSHGPPAVEVHMPLETDKDAKTFSLEATQPGEVVWRVTPESFSPAALVVLRHAGQLDADPSGFLACLRRGEAVPPTEVAELAQALHQLEVEYRGLPTMGRQLTFALHRLAFESQILHTDAWPDVFDVWTVDMLRSVHEAVERILSGQDLRYYHADGSPDVNGRPPGSPALDDRGGPWR